MGHIGVVDRQYLDDALVGLVRPVNHQFKVSEVAHAKTSFTAKREDRDDCTGSLPWIDGEICLRQFIDHDLTIVHWGQCHDSVGSILP